MNKYIKKASPGISSRGYHPEGIFQDCYPEVSFITIIFIIYFIRADYYTIKRYLSGFVLGNRPYSNTFVGF
jgi:hypothetical protein